ncbi:MAG TPA: 2-oxo acid dehydrogenase subunit E2 [bacterium]|nr:2-oxo acid dehydrogenase subunit E2 [bacterium]HPN45628.1 2-oxo acid dehydrogenase subunit E2 [bacterium]
MSSAMEIKLPGLGENIKSGTVVAIKVKVGDAVVKDQPIVELETEKAVLEVPADKSGVVSSIPIKEGMEVMVDQVLIVLAATGAETAPKPAEPLPQAKPQPPAEPVKPAAPVESKPGADAPAAVQPTAASAAPIIPASPEKGVPAPAAPSVRRFAREIGVDIHKVKGSGPNGRISIEDVKSYSKMLHEQYSSAPASGGTVIAAAPLPDFSKWGGIVREPMTKVREKTATHLSSAWATIPHVTQFDRADITEMEQLRKQFAPKAESAGGKLTMTAILLKIIAAALKVFPQFNASVDMASREIVYKKYVNIGVAVDTDRGLLVPVIRDVDKKNIVQLAVELNEIAKKARDKKLTLDDMQGGNFTISNLGGIGGTAFTPIINAPEVAILGVSRARMEPVYVNDEFVPRLILPLSLSYDHRLIDGADAARFTRWVVESIEQPFKIVLEG